MVKKDPKPGINPDTGLPYPPRRRLTLDYRKVNSVVQVDAARIPDVKETVQSLRVLAGESQRQVNARRDGTRKSIHDHDAAASWNLNADKLPDPEDYLCASIDLVHAFHQLVLSEEDRPKWAFGNRDLGCWCFTRAPQGAKGSPAAWYNYCTAVLQAHGCLHTPDFDVADLETIDMTMTGTAASTRVRRGLNNPSTNCADSHCADNPTSTKR
eukprot:COSAG01_NODE_7811_length_3046_cov_12.595860_2_plen_212_part_00